METWTDGIAYQEGNHARIKQTRERGRITVTVGGVGYVLMVGTNESELFAAYVEMDAYYIELVTPEDTTGFRFLPDRTRWGASTRMRVIFSISS